MVNLASTCTTTANANVAVAGGGGKETITQEELQAMYSALVLHMPRIFTNAYRPTLDKLKPIESTGASPEQLIYEYLTDPTSAPSWFRKQFICPEEEDPRTTRDVLEQSGAPLLIVRRYRESDHRPTDALTSWAARYSGMGSPWLWIQGGEAATFEAAAAMVAVASAQDAWKVKQGSLLWLDWEYLCRKADSMDRYGSGSALHLLDGHEQAQLAVVDGLGRERPSGHNLDLIDELVSSRHSGMLTTIFTSSATCREWADRYRRTCANDQLSRITHRIIGGVRGFSDDTDLPNENVIVVN